MRNIKAGDLRHRVELQKPTVATNEKGRRIPTWTTVATVMAGKKDVSGREYYVAQAYHAENTVTFTIRWREDVAPAWRVCHRGVAYEVVEVNHLGYMRDYIQLKCRTVQGEDG